MKGRFQSLDHAAAGNLNIDFSHVEDFIICSFKVELFMLPSFTCHASYWCGFHLQFNNRHCKLVSGLSKQGPDIELTFFVNTALPSKYCLVNCG